jgi:hypothetical protein
MSRDSPDELSGRAKTIPDGGALPKASWKSPAGCSVFSGMSDSPVEYAIFAPDPML